MAFSVWLEGVGCGDPTRSWLITNVPWPERSLRTDSRFRLVDRNAGYADYVAVLTVEEARAINAGPLAPFPGREAVAAEIEERLAGTRSGLVVACVYEWESGLGD